MNTVLDLRHIEKEFAHKRILKNVSFSLNTGNLGCLLGPSGCGKTTLLRIIAGFETPDSGETWIHHEKVASSTYSLTPEKRKIGMVFQDYALFPHLSVCDNIGFGLRRISAKDKQRRITELLELVGMAPASDYFPHELSGGQQQRVALARALALRPEILLMDEPFSNLDVTLRERLSMEIRDILKASGISALMVTHNQQEAFAMADVVGVMHDGKIEQWDTPHSLYHHPVSPIVANFIGEGVLLPGKVTGPMKVETGLGTLMGRFIHPCQNGCTARVLVRPEDIVHDHAAKLKAKIMKKNFRGANILYTLMLPTYDKILALVPSHHNHHVGQEIGIVPQVEDIILFEQASCPLPIEKSEEQVIC